MIELSEVSFSYPRPKRLRDLALHPLRAPQRVMAVEGVNLVLKDGDRIALLGANGAGKTTLLKLLGGLLYPTRGKVLVNGVSAAWRNGDLRSRVGYVINEERSFYWRLTGYENLEFFGALNHLQGLALRERAMTLLEQVGLLEHAHKRVSDYSSGMRQRLALARGLLTKPDILLLDEPTRSLDPLGAELVRGFVREATRTGGVRLLAVTTNQLEDVASICTRFCMLRGQRVAALDVWNGDFGTLRRLYASEAAATSNA